MSEHARSLPLTDLSEDEAAFRRMVGDFADEKIRPRVHDMDEAEEIPREVIDACFELGLMGIEIPEEHGGAAAPFFMSILAIEQLARVDPSLAVLVDVQNTLVNNALLLPRPEQGVLRAAFRAPLKPFHTATHKTCGPAFKAIVDWVASGDDPRRIPTIVIPALRG